IPDQNAVFRRLWRDGIVYLDVQVCRIHRDDPLSLKEGDGAGEMFGGSGYGIDQSVAIPRRGWGLWPMADPLCEASHCSRTGAYDISRLTFTHAIWNILT